MTEHDRKNESTQSTTQSGIGMDGLTTAHLQKGLTTAHIKQQLEQAAPQAHATAASTPASQSQAESTPSEQSS